MSDLNKLAILYAKAIQDEFPRYECYLADNLDEHGEWYRLHVHDGRTIVILSVIFAQSFIKIISGRANFYNHREDVVIVNYADPEFTEDVLSKILRVYENASYLDKIHMWL